MSASATQPARRRSWLAIAPLVIFVVLAGLFLSQLLSDRDTSVVPSALIGHTAPSTDLQPLNGMNLPGLSSSAFAGKVTLVNVFASWCAPCRQEHPLLMELSKDERVVIAALNYKDVSENARRFLAGLGNPYDAIGVDGSGRTAIDWGVYGVPETFLVGRDGKIAYKHVGPFTLEIVERDLKPALEKALGN